MDLRSGSLRTVATLNPEYQNITLGEVSELRWKNKYGVETNGYLIKPGGYRAGERYPLLVILYHFTGAFISQAEWITSYPAQAFAANGFLVLLMNYPRHPSWSSKDFGRGSVAVGYGPLSSMQEAVGTLVEKGMADPSKVGVLGWSYGCFLVEFAITQSSLFKVASAGDGGDYNPGIYWLLGRRANRENYERVMGGPPYGKTLRNYAQFSPAMNAHGARVPLLMEFNPDEALFGLEFFSALRRHNVPVELYIYPGEGHNFAQPVHRFSSMSRNLDWFKFWLKGEEDADPAKTQKYERWRELRKQYEENMKKLKRSPKNN